MLKSAVAILESVDLNPPLVFGDSIDDRARLVAALEQYRRLVSVTFIILYLIALIVAAGTILLAYRTPESPAKGLLPYAGGAAFVGLMEFARRLTKEWLLITLPLAISRHATDEQLRHFVGHLLTGIGRPQNEK